MNIKMMDAILEIGRKVYQLGKRFLQVDLRRTELSNVLQELQNKVEDMNQEARHQEAQPGKKRKKVVDAYSRQAQGFIESAQSVLNSSQEEPWMLKRMRWVPSIERYYREGQDLLTKGRQLREEGLTYDEVRMRGEMIPLQEDQFMGSTFSEMRDSAFRAMKDGSAQCIGIYGYRGAGKTELMKHLYNKVYEQEEEFKAVFWAKAPEFEPNHGNYSKALQNCVADGMWIDLDNDVVHDEVRCAGKIMARMQEIGLGRAVFFLDDVKEEFPAYELLGIPSPVTSDSTNGVQTVDCILVFSTLSKDVCNKMRCDLPLKMELLEKEEAKDLFLHEVNRGDNDDQLLSNQEQRIKEVAIQVANECAKMPLAIIVIARSMVGIKDLREWNNRLNEMVGTISSIHDEEDKILEQLKFGYICLKDRTVQRCFLEAANLLPDDRQVSKLKIIEQWMNRGLIGMDRAAEHADDQGHAILNQLERMCLLQVAPDHQTVTMNKWIWKMANTVS